MSYILKAQASFCSGEPLDVMCSASRQGWTFWEKNYFEQKNPVILYTNYICFAKTFIIHFVAFYCKIFAPASMNSPKSIVPLLLVSKVLKTFSLNLAGLPPGNILLYIEMNFSLVSSPVGQSFRKPLCQACNTIFMYSWLVIRKENCLPEFPLHSY